MTVDVRKPVEQSDMREVKSTRYPVTPDGRYFVVRGRLWRCSDPSLPAETRQRLVLALMEARRAKGAVLRNGDAAAREAARKAVDAAKHSLGERGAVWWDDGAPDLNRRLVKNTPYAAWFEKTENGADGQDE